MGSNDSINPKWGIIGAGTAGNRIASRFLTQIETDIVSTRVVFIKSGLGGSTQPLTQAASALSIDPATFTDDHLLVVEKNKTSRDYFEMEHSIKTTLQYGSEQFTTPLERSDSVMYFLGLGGMTGNRSVPYLIQQLSSRSESISGSELPDMLSTGAWVNDLTQFTLAIWPYDHEMGKRHFNAISGLSRLLLQDDGSPNTNMTILVSNSRMEELVPRSEEVQKNAGDNWRWINNSIVSALNLFISAGYARENPITPVDYAHTLQAQTTCHATFGTTLGNPVGVDLVQVIAEAADRTYTPVDVGTAKAIFLVVRAPEGVISNGDITQRAVRRAFSVWKQERSLGSIPGTATLLRGSTDSEEIDIFLCVGGFNLNPLLEHSQQLYEREKERIKTRASQDSRELVTRVESSLDEYISNSK